MLEELRRHREMVQGRIQKSFESDGLDVNSLIKSEGYDIEKAQENEYTEYSVNDLIKAGVLEYDDSIEKAVYADTAENRKLGRVGQEYHRGKGKKVEEKSAKKDVKTEEKKPADKKQKSEKNPVKLAAREFDKIVEPTNNWDDDDWNDMKKNDKLVKDLKSVVEKYNLSKKDFKEAFGHHAYGLDISYEDLKSNGGDFIASASKEFDKIVNETDNWDDDDWFDDKKQNKLISDLKAVVKKHNLSKEDFKTAWGHHAYGLDISYEDLTKANHIDIEKAVYADTAENRKLGRVGQEYHRGKGKKVEEKTVKRGVKTEEKKPTDKKQQNNENSENNTNKESKQEAKNGKMNFETAVNFLEENADWWSAYEYDTLDEDDEKERELKEKFESAEKFITKFKTFQIHSEKQEEKAKQYKKDMEAKGFKLVDFGQGSGIVHYGILKNK